MKRILVVNGPNLNRLGKREPGIYGKNDLTSIEERLIAFAEENGASAVCRQSNHEGDILDWIHEAEDEFQGIVLNAGAFTHYSYAIRDAIASVNIPVIEVHISNIHAREEFRHHSVIAPVAAGQIAGLGVKGYELAILAILGE
ncbi:3-dehydroquinate dehydratase [Fictibacillus solisalsi]|uniref:3-dehydroquinate dehydratase n=1 Tax=Fictibacillus solisalsi TaxID=459525 RepID=A0A1G9W8J5_9BACL|nr:type II 3-dehydroquinate dehydratase [Fictibacillus solisalsi]SDM80759.1 3-dehydroquinate dehydratase [Fictibacillus solisalsi]